MPGKEKKSTVELHCPYCNEEIVKASYPFCKPCKIVIINCPKCHMPTSRENNKCPHCGTDIKKIIK